MRTNLPEQKEKAKHGEQLFPIQQYITILSKEHPVVTAHWHDEAEFTLITEGHPLYQIQLNKYNVNPGDLLFLPPSVLHSISCGECGYMCSETYVFHMSFLGAKDADICGVRYLTPLTLQKLIPPFVITKEHPAYNDALDIFNDLRCAYLSSDLGYELKIKSLLLRLITLILPYCTKSSELPQLHTEQTEKLRNVLDYIDRHYCEPITVTELAGLCFFSEYYFMKFFKKYVGMTCMEYIKDLRLEKAAQMLVSENISSLDAAMSSGFNNLSYFHREFKKRYGVTPKKYKSLN